MTLVAHLSDLHISPMPRPTWLELANKRLIGYINWHKNRKHIHHREAADALQVHLTQEQADYTVLTGDMTNIALTGEFDLACRWMEKLGSPDKISLVPGNHDAYVPGIAKHCWPKWQPYMQSCAQGQAILDQPGIEQVLFTPFLKFQDKLAIVGINSSVPTPPFVSAGVLGQTQLSALQKILAHLSGKDFFRIVMLHHPPIEGKHNYFHGLRDFAAFQDVIQKAGAELILHGHTHKHQVRFLNGPEGVKVPVLGVVSASQMKHNTKPDARYNLYNITESANNWEIELTSKGFNSGHISNFGILDQHTLKIPKR